MLLLVLPYLSGVTEAQATGTNEELQIAYYSDLGLPTASTSFSEQTLVLGAIRALQSVPEPTPHVPVVPKPPKTGVYSPYPGSCLKSVQYWIPSFPKGVGVPNNVKPTHFYPSVGDAILTTESRSKKYPTGHTGEVIAVDPMVSVTIRECNYSKACGVRTLPLDSVVIRGYWSE